MKIVDSNPPEWIMQGCMNQFRINPKATVWTYGDTIYAPGRDALPDHILAHEEVHSKQQEAHVGGKDSWWGLFLSDPKFRMEQEASAYGVQYRFYCRQVLDRNRRALFLMQIAQHFSGPLYQLAITSAAARAMILERAGNP